eukprot:1068345_1
MGGIYGYYKRLMSFNVTSHEFIDHGNLLPIDVSEFRTMSFYSQLNNIVYISGDSIAIHSFNVLTQDMQTNIAAIPSTPYDEQCHSIRNSITLSISVEIPSPYTVSTF